jgi:hypothetical protein
MRTPKSVKQFLARIGKEGGKKGGRIRASRLTAKERSEAARKAVQARWAKAKVKKGSGE